MDFNNILTKLYQNNIHTVGVLVWIRVGEKCFHYHTFDPFPILVSEPFTDYWPGVLLKLVVSAGYSRLKRSIFYKEKRSRCKTFVRVLQNTVPIAKPPLQHFNCGSPKSLIKIPTTALQLWLPQKSNQNPYNSTTAVAPPKV